MYCIYKKTTNSTHDPPKLNDRTEIKTSASNIWHMLTRTPHPLCRHRNTVIAATNMHIDQVGHGGAGGSSRVLPSAAEDWCRASWVL
jgi:hypothetical protein